MSFHHPFQKLCALPRADGKPKVVLAATGPYISSFSLSRGEFLNKWPRDDDDEFSESDVANGNDHNSEPPKKRQRLEESRASSEDSIEIVSERVKGQRRKPKVANPKLPNVSHLLSTRDGKHIITVTAEDKCIRIFEVNEAGRLRNLSERCMPKRLCAITLTPDQATIVAGDKFGDVYSLPLLALAEEVQKPKPTQEELRSEFKPSATELTVHTRGNLEALRQQRKQKKLKPKKEGPSFEHKLLLGHVSLLTDVVMAQIPIAGQLRSHILTADRDEHIRVSRGMPQAHIIENYCSGHKEFVSKLCVLPWQQSVLVAGSGEPSLKVYHWPDGRMIDEVSFGDLVKEELSQRSALTTANIEVMAQKLAVSGIWPIDLVASKGSTGQETSGWILVALEGLPILLSYATTESGKLVHHQTIHLKGNALDVTVIRLPPTKDLAAVVSVDTVHLSGSCKEYRAENSQTPPFCHAFVLASSDSNDSTANGDLTTSTIPYTWTESSLTAPLNETITSSDAATATVELTPILGTGRVSGRYSPLGEFLYGLENLRKKRGAEAVEAEQEEDDDATAAAEAAVGEVEVE